MKHRNTLLKFLSIAFAVGAIILEIFAPAAADSIKYPALAICLVFIGIPHGAIDHILTTSLYDLSRTVYDQAKFYIYYLIMMALMAIIWIANPLIGFLLFALLTMYHFGQADLEYLSLNRITKRYLFLSRGAMIMGLILLGQPEYTSPVLVNITGIDLLASLSHSSTYTILLIFLPFQYFVFQIFVLTAHNVPAKRVISNSLDVLIVATLFIVVNPILAFTIYFGFWHSAGHVQEMLQYFQQTGRSMDLKTFYLKSIPLNAITFVGIGIIYWMSIFFNFQLQIVSLLFIIISVLTLPHMLIVEKMYSELQRTDP